MRVQQGPRARPARAPLGARTRGRMRECEGKFLGHSGNRHQLEGGRREGSQRPCGFQGARLTGEGRVHAEGGEGAPDNSA